TQSPPRKRRENRDQKGNAYEQRFERQAPISEFNSHPSCPTRPIGRQRRAALWRTYRDTIIESRPTSSTGDCRSAGFRTTKRDLLERPCSRYANSRAAREAKRSASRS